VPIRHPDAVLVHMINIPTVFILGAGASKPFGFPIGHELKEMILKGLKSGGDSGLYHKLQEFGIKPQLISKFYAALKDSGRSSVDSFLEHRREFLEIGKYSISMTLIPCERHDKLFDVDGTYANWYEYIYNKMNTSFDEFDKNKISFITFNYDRSLEYYLYTALKNSYGKNDMKCIEKIRNIKIIHFYGKLGDIFTDEPYFKAYMPSYDFDEIQNSSSQIMIMSECEKTQMDYVRANGAIRSADKVYFLGFGYNDVNLGRLGIDGEIALKGLQGSGLGLDDAEIDVIKKKWNIQIHDNRSEIQKFIKKFVYLE
jgi:hypothetical protein